MRTLLVALARANKSSTRAAAASLLVLVTAACGQELDALQPYASHEEEQSHGAAFVAQDEELQSRLLTSEDGWQSTGPLAADEPFNRAGVRFDAPGDFIVEGRSSQDGGETWTEWQALEITFQEEIAHNAHLDVPEGSTHFELRMMTPIDEWMSFLVVELFEYVAPVRDEAPLLEDTAKAEQGLVSSSVYVSRGAWGARTTYCSGSHTPNRMTVHHTVTPNNDSMSMPARMRQIQSFHINGRGWCDIGYHFLVGQDGKVYQGRQERKIGAHAGGANTNNAGVSFIGTFTSVAPSSAMMNAGGRILKALASSYGIALNRTYVKGHRQVGTTSTSCPGTALYNRLQNLIDIARGNPSGPPSSGFCAPSRTGTWCDGNQKVVCASGSQVSRVTCQHGCQSMPAGTPDQCAAPPPPPSFCADRTGTWCDGNQKVVCDDGRQVSRTTCQHGCQTMPQGTPDQCAAPPPPSAPPPPPSSPSSYSDVPSDHWAHRIVEELRERGALYGCAAGQFCPNDPISRADLAYAIAKLNGQSYGAPSSPTFSDVGSGHWGYAAIEEVAGLGVITGCGGGKFCPDESVSRAAGAVFVRRAKGLADYVPSSPSFSDVPLSHWGSRAIERLVHEGIVGGYADGSYRPATEMTRVHAALVLARAYGI